MRHKEQAYKHQREFKECKFNVSQEDSDVKISALLPEARESKRNLGDMVGGMVVKVIGG